MQIDWLPALNDISFEFKVAAPTNQIVPQGYQKGMLCDNFSGIATSRIFLFSLTKLAPSDSFVHPKVITFSLWHVIDI